MIISYHLLNIQTRETNDILTELAFCISFTVRFATVEARTRNLRLVNLPLRGTNFHDFRGHLRASLSLVFGPVQASWRIKTYKRFGGDRDKVGWWYRIVAGVSQFSEIHKLVIRIPQRMGNSIPSNRYLKEWRARITVHGVVFVYELTSQLSNLP